MVGRRIQVTVGTPASPPPPSPPSATGLLWNSTMLEDWQTRAASGPYRNAGDLTPNSPGDWSRIVANADAFRAGTTQPWNPGVAPIDKNESDAATEGRDAGFNLRDCAFRWLVLGDTADRDAAKSHLLAELRQPWMDVTNADWWVQGGNYYLDVNPLFVITELWTRYLLTYAFLGDDTFTAAERTEVRGIMEAAASFAVAEYNAQGYLDQFVDRVAGTITAGVDVAETYNGSTLAYTAGPEMALITHRMNNRRMIMNRYVGLVAAKWGDATLLDAARQQVVDYVRFGIYPSGALSDFYRETATDASLGWGYSAAALSSAVEVATAFYFGQGDRTLADYVSDVGSTTGPSSGPVADGTTDDGSSISLHQGARMLAKYVDQNVYARTGVRSAVAIDGSGKVHEAYIGIGNILWNDDYLHNIIARSVSGVGDWSTATSPVYEGNGRAYPGILFMFGGINAEPTAAPQPIEHVGAFATRGELDTWRTRSVQGPFRIDGDYIRNSPGVWTDIVGWKDGFMADPAASHYRGPVPATYTSGPITLGSTEEPSWTNHWRPIMAAAFYSMVADDAAVRQAVADRLVAQKDAIGLQFTDTEQWYPNLKNETDGNPIFYVAGIMGAYAICLDQVEVGDAEAGTTSITAANADAVRDWLYHAADFFADFVHDRISSALFTDRLLGDEPPYTPKNTSPTYEKAYDADTALSIYSWSRYFNNRRAQIIAAAGTLGRYIVHATTRTGSTYTPPAGIRNTGLTAPDFTTAAEQFLKDCVVYAFYPGVPDPFTAEFHRGVSVSGEGGWTYSASLLGALATVADAAIRDGRDLFHWMSRAGFGPSECAAGDPDKSLAWMMEELQGYVHQNRYAQAYDTEPIDAVNTAITAWPESQAAHDMQAYWIATRHLDPARRRYVESVVERTAAGITTRGWVSGLGGAFGSVDASVGDVGVHIGGPLQHWQVPLGTPAHENVGTFVTRNELTVWRQRSVNGPFLGNDDYAFNSPGEWSRVVGHKDDAMLNGLASYRWTPNLNADGTADLTTPVPYWHTHFRYLQATALFSLVANDVDTRSAAATELLAWAREPSLQMNDRAVWPENHMQSDQDPSWWLAAMMSALAMSFDFILAGDTDAGTTSFTALEANEIRDWFFHSAVYFADVMEDKINVDLFTDRATSAAPPYTPVDAKWSTPDARAHDEVFDIHGNTIASGNRYYNNRRSGNARWMYVGGIILARAAGYTPPTSDLGYGLADLLSLGEKYVKDYLVYTVFPEGYMGEFERAKPETTTAGGEEYAWAYSFQTIGPLLTIADLNIRHRNGTLMRYVTRDGIGHTASDAPGDPDKTLDWIARELLRYVEQVRYSRHHETRLIDSLGAMFDQGVGYHDIATVPILARHIADPDGLIAKVVERTHPDLSTSTGWVPRASGYSSYGWISGSGMPQDWGVHPTSLFQHWGVDL